MRTHRRPEYLRFHALLFMVFALWNSYAQMEGFSRQDSLRGSITPERAWWDLTYYDLHVDVDIENQSLQGTNQMHFRAIRPERRLQIDLQEPLVLYSAVIQGSECPLSRDGNVYYVDLPFLPEAGQIFELEMAYGGVPRKAIRAPWDGGFSWEKDRNGRPFVATSCQGLGASSWWPNKDHMYDEPDSMRIRATVPSDLVAVANGRLENVRETGGRKTFNWVVKNPINNYGVNINIGDYVRLDDSYKGLKGTLDLTYYVLSYERKRALRQFQQVKPMLEAFEHWFGPYPFYEDSFKLVEVPYLGMEHQSSVTYGNRYQNGYLGRDLSGTGQGLKFDFIIIHESGHEWFANNITYSDAADMWIHEGFTAYSESLFLEYHHGFEAAEEYIVGTRSRIRNDRPIIGAYGVNQEGSGDMYYKGSNMLHTLRRLVEDTELWREVLRGLNREFYHQTVSSRQVEDYISRKTGKDLSAFFQQYLRTTMIPILEYRRDTDGTLAFRYTNVVEGFDMPVELLIDGSPKWVFPDIEWKTLDTVAKDVDIHPGYLVDFKPAEY